MVGIHTSEITVEEEEELRRSRWIIHWILIMNTWQNATLFFLSAPGKCIPGSAVLKRCGRGEVSFSGIGI